MRALHWVFLASLEIRWKTVMIGWLATISSMCIRCLVLTRNNTMRLGVSSSPFHRSGSWHLEMVSHVPWVTQGYRSPALFWLISPGLFLHSAFLYFLSFFLFFFFGLFPFSWAAPTAYGGSQARSPTGAVATGLRHSHSNSGTWAMSATYITAHGNAGSLTHWARPGITPTTSWFLVG